MIVAGVSTLICRRRRLRPATIFAYVLLDACNLTSEVAITWNGSQGAYWGTPHAWESGYTYMVRFRERPARGSASKPPPRP